MFDFPELLWMACKIDSQRLITLALSLRAHEVDRFGLAATLPKCLTHTG
jgi:hypothetical protein